jgi:putative heme-binding domain-containing protein
MLTAQATADAWARLEKLYENATANEQATIARELEQGAYATNAKSLTSYWLKRFADVSASASPEDPLFRAALKFAQPGALARARLLTLDSATPLPTRRSLLSGIAATKNDDSAKLLTQLLGDPQTPNPLIGDVLTALAGVRDDALAAELLARYPQWPAELQQKVVATLATRPAWARALLTAIAAGKVPKAMLLPAQAQGIDRLGDKALSAQLETVWGRPLRPSSESRVRRIAEIRGILPEGDKGVAQRGREVFKKNCATCHQLFGDGMALGPELNGADRGNLDFLLTSIIDPSSQIRGEYQSVQVALKDGRVLHGLLADRSETVVSVIDANRQVTKVPKNEVDEMKASDVSLMPEGILDKLTDPEIRDLFRYLQSAGGQ